MAKDIHRTSAYTIAKIEELLNSLIPGQILHVTSSGTNYFYIRRSADSGIIYSINKSIKTLPLSTVNKAFYDKSNNIEINAKWYKNFNQKEYKTRGCNLQVLRMLLKYN